MHNVTTPAPAPQIPAWLEAEEAPTGSLTLVETVGQEGLSRLFSGPLQQDHATAGQLLIERLGYRTGNAIDEWHSGREVELIRLALRLGYALAIALLQARLPGPDRL